MFLIAAGLDCAAQNEVVYIWCGALTSHSVRVNAKMTDPSADLRLLVDEDSSFSTPTASPLYSVSLSTGMVAALEMDGLAHETKYY